MRDFIKSLSSSFWQVSMSGVEQMTKITMLPVTSVLANLGGPFRSATSAAEQQIDNLFQATVRVGDQLQRKTVDLTFDLLTLKPLIETLQASTRIGETPGAGYQSRPELDYLNTLLEAGPATTSTILLVMATLYSNLNQQAEGIERFEDYLQTYSAQLLPRERSVYLSCLALLRAGRAQQLPLWQFSTLIDLIQRALADMHEAKQLTENEPDFSDNNEKLIARWVSGLLQAQLPWPFGNRQVAREDLIWCERTITESQERKAAAFQFLREVYYSLALLYRQAGDNEQAQKYLELSRYESFDKKKILIATFYSCDPNGFRVDIKHVNEPIQESVPGKVFTLSGFDMSEFNFIISHDEGELMAIDAGSREDTARDAYTYLEKYYQEHYGKGLPKLTNVFITHAHWDHIGGHSFFKNLNPEAKFYSRFGYREVKEKSAKQPPPFQWYLGKTYKNEHVEKYEPTVVVGKDLVKTETGLEVGDAKHRVFELEVGGTRAQLILPHSGGGETRDGMFIYLPEYRVLYGGDFIVPWVGTPYLCEGDIDSLLGTIDLIAALDPPPNHILYGHRPLTLFYSQVETLKRFKPHLQWLKDETLKQIYAYKDRPTIQAMNLVPPGILDPSQADVQLPYLIMREVMIDRLYRQTVGYWGPQLHGVDYLSDEEVGAVFTDYLKLSDDDLAAVIERMIRNGDHELAGQIVDWVLTRRPDSARLKQAKESVFLKLKEKWQLIIPFKFVMYSEHIDNPTRQLE